jgi:hypothetical protein
MVNKYEIRVFPLFLLVNTEKTGCILPLKSASLGLSDSRLVPSLDTEQDPVHCIRKHVRSQPYFEPAGAGTVGTL